MNPVTRWILITRAYAFPASIIPILLSLFVGIKYGLGIHWVAFPLVLGTGVLFHTGTNLINDYYDFVNGIDVKGADQSTWAIAKNLVSENEARNLGILFFLLGFFLGIPLILMRGWGLAVLGLIGMAGGFFYTAPPFAYKYRGWGEICVFFLMGPLLCAAALFALTGKYLPVMFPFSLPLGFLVAAIMYGNNLRDIETDKRQDLKTLAVRLGYGKARWGYPFLILGAYAGIAGLYLSGRLGSWCLITFLAAPIFFTYAGDIIHQNKRTLQNIDIKTARLYLVFGCLYLIAVLLS